MAGRSLATASRINSVGLDDMASHMFWGYVSILFDFLLIFIIPLGVAIRELARLRRHDREMKQRDAG
jgi:hypothetical protein